MFVFVLVLQPSPESLVLSITCIRELATSTAANILREGIHAGVKGIISECSQSCSPRARVGLSSMAEVSDEIISCGCWEREVVTMPCLSLYCRHPTYTHTHTALSLQRKVKALLCKNSFQEMLWKITRPPFQQTASGWWEKGEQAHSCSNNEFFHDSFSKQAKTLWAISM